MQTGLSFYSTNGSVSGFDFDTEQSEIVRTLKLDSTVIDICITKTTPYVIKFKADKEIKMKKVCLSVNLDYLGDNILYYDAGSCTNAFASIRKYDKKDYKNYWARDIFMAQANNKVINIAFTTFRRFFTGFYFDNNNIVAEFNLEDKAILPNAEYELEHILVDDKLSALGFFEKYTEYLRQTHKIPEFKYIPCGWSSWSCYYGSVDEEKTLNEAKLLKEKLINAELIQIDDGWQKEGSFGAYWTEEYSKFPSGFRKLKR